ncbi:MAG TPA: formylglycine-generating enzyme family protein [Desulfobacteraceae bacterium]|nr:formylglycine-generating enzyme family protein [Desulfobacteraceae bacterium]
MIVTFSHYQSIYTTLAVLLLVLFSGLPPALSDPGTSRDKTIINHLGMTFVPIPPGSFEMGSPETEPFRDSDETLHTVTIKNAFYIQSTEVTVGQWRAVMGTSWLARKKGTEKMPVTRVSYYDCLEFIRELNKTQKGTCRLPTEAEWEYACRAGTQTAYSWGNHIDCSKAMFANNTKKEAGCVEFYELKAIAPDRPAPVGQFPPNPWGIYDMHGNVWEWCSDRYGQYQAGKKPGNQSDSRVRRGGSWYKYGQYLRSANRTYGHPGSKFKTTGFRLVLEAD